MKRTTKSAYTIQTKTGKYTSRLSNKLQVARHESFRGQDDFFRQLVDSLEDYAIFTTDIHGNVSSWNRGAERLLGYSEKEIIGKNGSLFFNKEDRENHIPEIEMQTARKKGRAKDNRWHVKKNDQQLFVSGLLFPLKDDHGNIRGFTKIMRDLTDKKKAQESEERFKTLIEQSSDAIQLLTKEGKILYSSDSVKKVLGYKPEEIEGDIVVPYIYPDDLPIFMQEFHKLLEKPRNRATLEYRVKHKNGEWIWIEATGVNQLENPTIRAIVGNFRNITDKKNAEISQYLLASIVMSSEDAIVSKRLDSVITTWNKSAERLFGYKAREVIGKSITIIIPPDLLKQEEEIISKIKRGIGIEHFETVRLRKDGTLIPVSLSISPIKDNRGVVIGAAKIARDITQQKTVERQKDDFVGVATHELKTPVTSIKAYTQILKRRFQKAGSKESSGLLAKMDAQLDKLITLISDLLDITKIEAGKMSFNLEQFNFNALVGELVEELQRTTTRHNIEVTGKASYKVYGDRDRTGQVLTNLISNAIKYSPHSTKIIVSVTQNEQNVTLCVQDFGVGISKQKQEKVFERFYRVSGPREDTFPGLGLGLYISSEIIKRLGGRIWVESTKGKGSKFCFSLPFKKRKIIGQQNTRVESEMKHE